jgi:hypothetical protein
MQDGTCQCGGHCVQQAEPPKSARVLHAVAEIVHQLANNEYNSRRIANDGRHYEEIVRLLLAAEFLCTKERVNVDSLAVYVNPQYDEEADA